MHSLICLPRRSLVEQPNRTHGKGVIPWMDGAAVGEAQGLVWPSDIWKILRGRGVAGDFCLGGKAAAAC